MFNSFKIGSYFFLTRKRPNTVKPMHTEIVIELPIIGRTLKSIQSNSPCLLPLKKAKTKDVNMNVYPKIFFIINNLSFQFRLSE